jgi:two-component system NtrC family sensor kinase
MPKLEIAHWLSHLRIQQKIGLGYALALGIAVSGTAVGFVVGEYHFQKALKKEEHARNEIEKLHLLQTNLLEARTHQQQLIALVQNQPQFQEEYSYIPVYRLKIEQTWNELSTFVAHSPTSSTEIHQVVLPKFLQTYEGVTEQYFQELDRLFRDLLYSDLDSPTQVAQAQTRLINFTNSEFALEFDRITEKLVELIEIAYDEAHQVEEATARSTQWLYLVVGSMMGISVAIAVLLAIAISRAIAQPIQELTRIAQRSIQESNFDLQVPATNKDEIGVLGRTFNQLIRSVKDLLDQQQNANARLAAYNHNLEKIVRDRTQEISDKNHQLQELVEKLKQTQIQVVQSEKMSSLGQLVAGVAHEINNPVNFIHGNLVHIQNYSRDLMHLVQLYQKSYPNPAPEIEMEVEDNDLDFLQEDLPKILSSMEIGTARIRQIVLSLRNFSRMDEAEFKAVDLHEGIESTLLILQHRLKAKPERPEVRVIRDYGKLPLVECYAGQLNQVFMNLFANAIDALEERNGTQTYQEIEANPNQISIRTSTVDGEWVNITIADNGLGMSEEVKKQIFNPFFTTKPAGKGTGMGMAIAYQIVTEKHHGTLVCFSTPGAGTEFVIQIPLRQQNCEQRSQNGNLNRQKQLVKQKEKQGVNLTEQV